MGIGFGLSILLVIPLLIWLADKCGQNDAIREINQREGIPNIEGWARLRKWHIYYIVGMLVILLLLWIGLFVSSISSIPLELVLVGVVMSIGYVMFVVVLPIWATLK